MKKILSLFIAIMIISTCVFAQSTVAVSKGSSQRIDFSEAFSENSVIQFNYNYSESFTSGSVSYKLYGDNGAEVFRMTLSVDAGVPKTHIYSKKASSLSASLSTDDNVSGNNGLHYNSVSLFGNSGKFTFAVDLEGQRVMIKHTDALRNKEEILTNDYLWGMSVTEITGFEIDATDGVGVNVTDFEAFVPENFREYYHFARKYDFQDLELESVVSSTGVEIRSTANKSTVVSDPENFENKVIKVTGDATANTTFQVRPTRKYFGLTGDVYIKAKVRYTTTASVRTVNIYQFGGYSATYGSGSYGNTHLILETLATSAQFEAKNNTTDWPKVAGIRQLNKWHQIEYYLNTDTDKIIMYVDGTPIAMKDSAGNFIEEFRDFRNKADFVNLLQFTTNTKATTFYVDDVEVGMYVPYTGASSEEVIIDEENMTVTGLWDGITASELISAVTTDGKVYVKDAYGEKKTEGELTVGDVLFVSDITGNFAQEYALPEILQNSISLKYGEIDAVSNTATACHRTTVQEYIEGINCDVPYEANILKADKSGVVTGYIQNGNIFRIKIGTKTYDFVISGDKDWDFETEDSRISAGTGECVENPTADGDYCYKIENGNVTLDLGVIKSGKVSVSADILFKTNTNSGRVALKTSSGKEYATMTFQNEELIRAYASYDGGETNNLSILSNVTDPSIWTRYTFEIDHDTDTFILYRNNVPMFVEALPLFKPADNVRYLYVSAGNGSEIYVDNINVHSFEPLKPELSSASFMVDNEFKMITEIPFGTTVEELLGAVNSECEITVWDKLGNEKSEGVLTPDDTLYVKNRNAHCNYALGFTGDTYSYEENYSSIKTGLSLYVSPSGSDENSGLSTETPFKTLNACADYIKENKADITGDVVINMMGGIYEFSEANRFNKNCNLNGRKIVIQPYNGADVTITGGKSIMPSEFGSITEEAIKSRLDENIRNNVLEYDMSKLDSEMFGSRVMSGWNLRFVPSRFEFYKNTKLEPLARYPDNGLVITDSIIDKESTFKYLDTEIESWAEPTKAWIWSVFGNAYGGHDIRIGSVDTETDTVTVAASYQNPSAGNFKYYYDNVLEEITMPGEWYYDDVTNKIYYYPDSDFSDSTFYISLLSDNVLSFYNVDNVYIKDITFVASRGDMLGLYDCNNVLIENCTISGAGMNGVIISGGRNNNIADSEVCYTGGDAVKITAGNIYTLTPSGSGIYNCELHDFSKRKKAYTGAVWAAGAGITIKGNSIYDGPHLGIQLKGNDILIENNTLTNLVSNAKDMGAIYTYNNYVWRGNKILNNRFENIRNADPGTSTNLANAVFLDNFSSGYEIKRNIFINCDQGVATNGGRDNVVTENVFYKTGKINISRNFAPVNDPPYATLNTMPVSSELWKERYKGIEETQTLYAGTPYGTLLGNCLLLDYPNTTITDRAQIRLKDNIYSSVSDYSKIRKFKYENGIDELNMGATANSEGYAERIYAVIDSKVFEGTYELKLGESVQLGYVVTGKAGKTDDIVEISSRNSEIASVDSSFLVTGNKLGTTTVTLTSGDIAETIKIKIIK